MKKLFFSTILVFAASMNLQTFALNSDAYVVCVPKSIFQDNIIYVYKIHKKIDQETASKIDEFIIRRKGVVSCVTNVSARTLTISVLPELSKTATDELFEIVHHRFLE